MGRIESTFNELFFRFHFFCLFHKIFMPLDFCCSFPIHSISFHSSIYTHFPSPLPFINAIISIFTFTLVNNHFKENSSNGKTQILHFFRENFHCWVESKKNFLKLFSLDKAFNLTSPDGYEILLKTNCRKQKGKMICPILSYWQKDFGKANENG